MDPIAQNKNEDILEAKDKTESYPVHHAQRVRRQLPSEKVAADLIKASDNLGKSIEDLGYAAGFREDPPYHKALGQLDDLGYAAGFRENPPYHKALVPFKDALGDVDWSAYQKQLSTPQTPSQQANLFGSDPTSAPAPAAPTGPDWMDKAKEYGGMGVDFLKGIGNRGASALGMGQQYGSMPGWARAAIPAGLGGLGAYGLYRLLSGGNDEEEEARAKYAEYYPGLAKRANLVMPGPPTIAKTMNGPMTGPAALQSISSYVPAAGGMPTAQATAASMPTNDTRPSGKPVGGSAQTLITDAEKSAGIARQEIGMGGCCLVSESRSPGTFAAPSASPSGPVNKEAASGSLRDVILSVIDQQDDVTAEDRAFIARYV